MDNAFTYTFKSNEQDHRKRWEQFLVQSSLKSKSKEINNNSTDWDSLKLKSFGGLQNTYLHIFSMILLVTPHFVSTKQVIQSPQNKGKDKLLNKIHLNIQSNIHMAFVEEIQTAIRREVASWYCHKQHDKDLRVSACLFKWNGLGVS